MAPKKGMVMTVGTGTGQGGNEKILAALAKSFAAAHPDLLVMICSRDSASNARALAAKLQIPKDTCLLAEIPDENDLQECFAAGLKAFGKLQSRGIPPSNVVADFTSGTKAMSAGLVLAATACRTGQLSYISGPRQAGTVICGRERVTTFAPNVVTAHHALELALCLFEKLRFEAAINLLTDETVGLLPEQSRLMGECLRQLSQAYHKWELFDHRGAIAAAKRLPHLPVELRRFMWSKATEKSLQVLAAEEGRNAPGASLERLADLFCNAERRAAEGKYDDAVARLYRATEMLAQLRLKEKYGIDAGNADPAKLPEQLRERLVRSGGSIRGDRIKLGLHDAYDALSELGDPIGAEYTKSERLKDALKKRNDSLLAHGFRPVTREDYEQLRDELLKLIGSRAVKGFGAARRALTFTWMRPKT